MIAPPDQERKIADRIDGVPHPAEHHGLVGHEDALALLINQYRSGRMHHAWLLNGPRGIGKATLAFHFASHVFRNPDASLAPDHWQAGAPSDTVDARIAAGSHPNLMHLTRPWDFKVGKFKTRLTVDEIRLTIPFFGTARGERGWRIAIIDSMDDMNQHASNSLLKILEEPPDNTLFFIISHTASSIPATIRSRCQALPLKPLTETAILLVLERLGITSGIGEADRSLLVRLSNGSVRRAIILAQSEGLELYKRLTIACKNLVNPDWPEIHALADQVCRRGREDRYRILLDMADEFVEARATGKTGEHLEISTLARWAEVWEKTRHHADLAENYNLDRKQVILNLFQSMGEAAKS